MWNFQVLDGKSAGFDSLESFLRIVETKPTCYCVNLNIQRPLSSEEGSSLAADEDYQTCVYSTRHVTMSPLLLLTMSAALLSVDLILSRIDGIRHFSLGCFSAFKTLFTCLNTSPCIYKWRSIASFLRASFCSPAASAASGRCSCVSWRRFAAQRTNTTFVSKVAQCRSSLRNTCSYQHVTDITHTRRRNKHSCLTAVV